MTWNDYIRVTVEELVKLLEFIYEKPDYPDYEIKIRKYFYAIEKTLVTYCIGSDMYACEIVPTENRFLKNKLYAKRKGWDILETFPLRKDKTYRPVGSTCGYLKFGESINYGDPDIEQNSLNTFLK